MDGDDASVKVGDDGFEDAEPRIITNTNPNFLLATYYAATSFLSSYGWTVLVVIVFLIVIWSNIESRIRKMLEKRRESKNPVETSPELLAQRAEAMELARQRMQEKASAVLKQEADRRKELEEKKRLEQLEDYDALKFGRSSHATQRKVNHNEKLNHQAKQEASGNKSSGPQARPLRNDYNSLTGSSSSSRYRPAPRSTGGG